MRDKAPEETLKVAHRPIPPYHLADIPVPAPHMAREQRWGYAFLGFLGVLLLALLFTPGLPLQWKMYAVVHGICAQQHNIFFGTMQFPICARNSGIYSSFLITTVYLWAIGRGRAGHVPPWSVSAILLAFVAIMAVDGFNSLFVDLGLPYFYVPRNSLRTLTGMGMGVGIAVMLLLILNTTLRKNVNDQQPVLKNLVELGGVLLINFMVLVALYGNLELLFWPLAFISFFGIIGVLYLVNVLLVSLLMGYEGTVTHPIQLARPATVALVPTLVILAILSALRFWLESQGLIL